jgi:IS30 family transposase
MEKWSCRNPLTIEDRKVIQMGIKSGLSSREIGREIDRDKSIILRESKRLGGVDKYDATKAQENFENKQIEGRRKSREKNKMRRSILR